MGSVTITAFNSLLLLSGYKKDIERKIVLTTTRPHWHADDYTSFHKSKRVEKDVIALPKENKNNPKDVAKFCQKIKFEINTGKFKNLITSKLQLKTFSFFS